MFHDTTWSLRGRGGLHSIGVATENVFGTSDSWCRFGAAFLHMRVVFQLLLKLRSKVIITHISSVNLLRLLVFSTS